MFNKHAAHVFTALVVIGSLSKPVLAQSMAEQPTTPPPAPERQAAAVEKNLKIFDVLDFDVFSNQKWDWLQETMPKTSS
jgi:hypothetical protein